MLELKNVSVAYDKLRVVEDVNLYVDAGETLCIIGSNGAGKTTLLKTLSGIKRADKGSIYFKGVDITSLSSSRIVSLGLIQVAEGRQLFNNMTVEENLILGSFTKKAKQKRKENIDYVYELLPVLKEKRKEYAGDLSGGQQQMLAIGRGIMACPELIIFDEPSIGLSPLLTRQMFNIIESIKGLGITVLIVEQNVWNALKLSDRAYVIEQGRIVMSGRSDELARNKHLKEAYLGM